MLDRHPASFPQYCRRTDAHHQFDTATDEHAIVALLRALCQQMGFDHFRLGFIFPISIQRPEARIFNGSPAQWEQTHGSQLDHVVMTLNKAAGLGVFG